jgi:hypothetical protein
VQLILQQTYPLDEHVLPGVCPFGKSPKVIHLDPRLSEGLFLGSDVLVALGDGRSRFQDYLLLLAFGLGETLVRAFHLLGGLARDLVRCSSSLLDGCTGLCSQALFS